MEPSHGPGTDALAKLDALYEFDREPVKPDRWLGPGSFAGSYAGEHVAATEFVIGALFVSWGARMGDVIGGLILGNLAAVLSWGLVCGPLAVQTRLTLYWVLRRIAGGPFCLIYNVLNAVMFCVLAGCMITVSASAVRLPFGIPPQVAWYPTDARFVAVVLGVGAVVVVLAILGFQRLARFASVCAPWMLLMFGVGALAMWPPLRDAAGVAGTSWSEIWAVGERAVWIGTQPDGSPPALGFWDIAAFAWIANVAMHLGLADMALLRFARRKEYGFYSACGMFLGHYLAWIWAGAMGAGAALLLKQPLTALDAGSVAYEAMGVCGALAVVVAGWTTANPTLYRAGLALQAITPDWSRARVTLAVGAVTTGIACFPFVFTRLLEFVGLYGILLAPAGAIVVAELWVLPRWGIAPYWLERRGGTVNGPAFAAWGTGVGLALGLWGGGVLHLFHCVLPSYVATLLVYAGWARWAAARGGPGEMRGAAREAERAAGGERKREREPVETKMGSRPGRWVWGSLALLGLGGCVAGGAWVAASPPGLFEERHAWMKLLLVGPTLLYGVSALMWAGRE